jgi:hypothetical protein
MAKEAVCPAETEAESAEAGLVTVKAAGALATTLRTCGELGASLVTEMVSLRGPEESGAKVMEMVQAALGATTAFAQVATELEKSAGLFPPEEMPEMCSGALLGLLMVTLVATLARPCVTGEKLTEAGAKRRTGPELLEARPVPVRLMECGLPGVLSVNVSVA